MATLQPTGFLCYNNSDLVRDGYIYPVLTAVHDLSEESSSSIRSWERKIARGSTKKGVRYTGVYDANGNLIEVNEKRRMLPAEKIKLDIKFSKTMKSVLQPTLSPGQIPLASYNFFSPIPNGSAGGGIASSMTYLTYHLCDSSTFVNRSVQVTQEILDNGYIDLPGYPLSIFAVVTEHTQQIGAWDEDDLELKKQNYKNDHPQAKFRVNEESEVEAYLGLDFKVDQLDNLGRFSGGVWNGLPRVKIDGATGKEGRFGDSGDAYLRIVENAGDSNKPADQEVVLFEDQKDIFVQIIRDERRYKFRADNQQASGQRSQSFKSNSKDDIAQDKKIEIDVTDLEVGDFIYITMSIATKRHVRQCVRHLGKVGQGNMIAGLIGWTLAIGSELEVFDYKIKEWLVPKIESSEDKLTQSEYVSSIGDEGRTVTYDLIEGWRVADGNGNKINKFWAADYRGILLFDNKIATVVVPASVIRDRGWWRSYLESLEFTYPTGIDPTDPTGETKVYTEEDLTVKLDYELYPNSNAGHKIPGHLYDISESTNTLLFDNEKIPYYRPFAVSLNNVSSYNSAESGTGVGCVQLDLKDIISDLDVFDLSFAEFERSPARPRGTDSCAENYDEKIYYSCDIYDGSGDNGSTMYDSDWIENDVLGWRPGGGTLSSFWMLTTPYFCGNYSTSSRCYIEYIGGNSVNSYSFIYADTWPAASSIISMDRNLYRGNSYVVHQDQVFNNCMSIFKLKEGVYRDIRPRIEFNKENIPEKGSFGKTDEEVLDSHEKYQYIGYNNILGDYPSYSHGSPINDELSQLCENWTDDYFEEVDFMDGTYGLSFEDEVPTIEFPSGKFLRKITIEFVVLDSSFTVDDQFITLYFESSEGVINTLTATLNSQGEGVNTYKIDCSHYYGSPLHIVSKFWDYIEVKSVKGILSPDKYSNYRIDSGQMAVVNDEFSRVLVFFADENSGNISVAMSEDSGSEWVVYSDIIRLVKGETASLPFAFINKESRIIHLFYVLNGGFLMRREVPTSLFNKEDLFVSFEPLDEYGVNSDDDDLNSYSDEGKALRRMTSYFVDGSATEPFFTSQIEIADDIKSHNSSLDTSDDDRKSIRFDFIGDTEEMTDSFQEGAYSVYIDDEGVNRLFFVRDGNFYIKRSSNLVSWEYDIEDFVFHKTFFDDELNGGEPSDIKNIQVVRNTLNNSEIYVLYFSNEMLFLRRLQSSRLFPDYNKNEDGTATKDISKIEEHLNIVEGSSTRPLFLVGSLPSNIKEKRLEEIENGISVADSDLAIKIFYDADMTERMDSRFSIDSNTQSWGYTLDEGELRVFYKDSSGLLNSLVINGVSYVTPDIMFDRKKN